MADAIIKAGIQINAQVGGGEQIDKLVKSIEETSDVTSQLNQETQKLQQLSKSKAILGLDVDDKAQQKIRELNAAYNYLRQNGNLTKSELKRATQAYKAELNSLNQTLEQSSHKMTPLASSIGKIGMAAAGAVGGLAALQKGLSDVLAATQEYQAIATRFTYAFDGAEEGAKQLAFVREEAQRLGLEFMGAANGYAQFAAAAKDVNISTEQTQSIFKGVAAAAATMGLSADDANGVFLALSQIAGKGKVSMEELRGQLGERLAPAMSIAAKAMGVTTAELEKMVENGLAAETFLPRFGAALEEAFSKDAASNAQSLNGQINLLKNSYNEFLVKLGEGSVGAGMVAVMKDIGAALEFAKQKFDEFSQSENGKYLEENLSNFYQLVKEIGSTIVNFFSIAKDNIEDFANATSTTLSGNKTEMDLLQAVLDGVNLTLAAMRDGVTGVGIAFDLFAGAAKDFLGFMADGLSKITFGDLSKQLKQAAADLRQEAEKNYESANQAALNFESHTARVWQSMADRANQTKEITEQANQSVKQSVDETAKAAAKTDELSQAYKDAQTAVSGFGLDMRAAMNEATPAMAEAQSNLAKLSAGFHDLKEQGVNASVLLNQALAKMTETASNQADIDLLKREIKQLGNDGKISFEEVERAILAVDVRLQELKGNIDPTTAAFKKLGIQTKEALRLSAEETRLAFERVKASGQATSEDLKKAFANTANALLASGDVSQKAWVESQAFAYDYKVTIDDTGKASLEAAAKTQEAAKKQVSAHKEVAKAASEASEATKEQAKETDNATKSAEKQGKALDEISMRVSQSLYKTRGWLHLMTPAWSHLIDNLRNMHIETDKAMKKLNASLETGVNLSENLGRAQAIALSHADKLDDVTLSNLNQAIDKAKQKVKELSDEARNTRQELEKELLGVQGNEDAVAKLEQERKINDLRQRQAEAKRHGNSEAVAEFEKSIALQNKIFDANQRKKTEERKKAEAEQRAKAQREAQEQARKRAEEEQREFERVQQQVERERAEREKSALEQMVKQEPKVDIQIDAERIQAMLNGNYQNVGNQAVEKLLKEFAQAMSQQR